MYKNIIMIYHIPIDNLTRQQTNEVLTDAYDQLLDENFYKVFVFPYVGGKPKKAIIETIDLNNTINNKIIEKQLDKLIDTQLKYFEPEKWKRVNKLKNLIYGRFNK